LKFSNQLFFIFGCNSLNLDIFVSFGTENERFSSEREEKGKKGLKRKKGSFVFRFLKGTFPQCLVESRSKLVEGMKLGLGFIMVIHGILFSSLRSYFFDIFSASSVLSLFIVLRKLRIVREFGRDFGNNNEKE